MLKASAREAAVPKTDVKERSSRRAAGFPWSFALFGALLVLALAVLATWNNGTLAWQRPAATSKLTQAQIPFDGERAYGHLKAICAIGQRISATEGMARQQAYLQEHFTKLGGKVTLQSFPARHPETGKNVQLANLIVEWHPERKERILLCAHYDTRPFPDQDPTDPKGLFVGANDGASGVAILCELAQHMPGLKSKYGVDFVLFDGEELVFDKDRDPYFLGSEHFAREYKATPPAHNYASAVLLDMVGDANLQIFREVGSMRTPKTRALVNEIWSTARDLGVREFVFQTKYEIRDDHLALNNIAGIPAIDIIDFEYPTYRENYWHTTRDVPANCSALSLAKVGWVLKSWLEKAK
jgi:glutaminyl-peptide cyclotransferase